MPLNNIPSASNTRAYGAPAALGGVNGFFPRLLSMYSLPNIPMPRSLTPQSAEPPPAGSYQMNFAGPQITAYQPVITNLTQLVLPTTIQPIRETVNNTIFGPNSGDKVREERIDSPTNPTNPTVPPITIFVTEGDPDAIAGSPNGVSITLADQLVSGLSLGSTTLDIAKKRIKVGMSAVAGGADNHTILVSFGAKTDTGSVDTIPLETCVGAARFLLYDNTLISVLPSIAVSEDYDVQVDENFNISSSDSAFDGLTINSDYEVAVNEDESLAYDSSWVGGELPLVNDASLKLVANDLYVVAHGRLT